MPVPAPAKRAAIIAAALLIGAPTAGAALRSEAPAPPGLSDGLIRIELVIPPEPEVIPAYPLATLDEAPANEFKRPPRASKWGYGFAGLEPVVMWAEPPGAGVEFELEREPDERLAVERSAPAPASDLPSSFEPASGWLDD